MRIPIPDQLVGLTSAITPGQERLNVANKMADKKKQAGQSGQRPARSQAPELAKKSSEKEQPVKSIKAAGGDGVKAAAVSPGAKAVAREERKERVKVESRPVRRESRGPSTLEMRIRNNRIGRFALEAYYELRHKVTWPTFDEARNMTFVVIGLSVAVGAVLGLADYGLQALYFLIGK